VLLALLSPVESRAPVAASAPPLQGPRQTGAGGEKPVAARLWPPPPGGAGQAGVRESDSVRAPASRAGTFAAGGKPL